MTDSGLASVLFIMKNILRDTKVSACWIPNEQKRTRVQMVQMTKQLLKMYPKYQKKVFDSLITDDETWVLFMSPSGKLIIGYRL